MPIDIERFETDPVHELTASTDDQTNAEQVLSHLASNDDRAFTPKEIREATGIPRGSIGVVLSRLEEQGLVRHRGEYWAIGEDVGRELTVSETARAAGDRFGPEDPDDWGLGVETADSEDE